MNEAIKLYIKQLEARITPLVRDFHDAPSGSAKESNSILVAKELQGIVSDLKFIVNKVDDETPVTQ